jgi:ribosomal RNA-processing protein 8
VDSAAIVQEKPTSKSDPQPHPSALASASRKRKSTHSHNQSAPKVSGRDLEKLWDQKGRDRSAAPKSSSTSERHGHKSGTTSAPRAGKEEAVVTGSRHRSDKVKNKSKENFAVQDERRSEDRKHHSNSRDRSSRLSNGEVDGGDDFPRAQLLRTFPPAPPASTKLTPLQAKMRSKLTSARFRHLNEMLYTTSSAAAMDLFANSPDLFAEYHAGFSQQVKEAWPVNPVDKYVAAIRTRGAVARPNESVRASKQKAEISPLPYRPKTSLCTIADLGCGDALLARGCQSVVKTHKLKFHNFDLHASSTMITKADISNLPLRDGEVDVAVFCLSLMGTNWVSFVEEAWRILRGDGKGECWVSEVKSRFGRVGRRAKGEAVENSVGKKRKKQRHSQKADDADDDIGPEVFAEDAAAFPEDETDISAFVKVFTRRGFQLREESVDKSNKMFVSMTFVKSGIPTAGKHRGLKWTGREYQKIDLGKAKQGGGADEDGLAPEEEAKVLKACVYKTR